MTKNLHYDYLEAVGLANTNNNVEVLRASPNLNEGGLVSPATNESDEQLGNSNSSSSLSSVNYELIDMLLIDLRKYIASSVVVWNTKMSEFFKKPKFEEVIKIRC